MDNARALFDQFKNEGLALIQRAVEEKWPEDGFLDFKTLSRTYPPGQSDDWNSLATGISGFGNADGGVLVWGVLATEGTRKEPGIAVEAKPIGELSRFVRDLQRESSRVTAPVLPGVEHYAVPEAGDSDRGFVVTFVPKGEGDPVMRLNEKRYYIRVGDSFVGMDHWMIADRFHRRPQPSVRPAMQVWAGARFGGRGPDATLVAKLAVGVKNIGRGIALHPSIALTIDGRRIIVHAIEDAELGRRRVFTPPGHPAVYRFSASGSEAAHPGRTLQAAVIDVMLPLEGDLDDLRISYWIDCDGAHESGAMVVPSSDLEKLRDPQFKDTFVF